MRTFIFDLEGALLREGALLAVAGKYSMSDSIDGLVMDTAIGNVPYVEGLIKSIHLMANLPVDEICAFIGRMPLNRMIYEFIWNNSGRCLVVTGILDCWVREICEKIGCRYFTSEAIVESNGVKKISSILHKERVVEDMQNGGGEVVFIGGGNDDLEAMRIADISIASGLGHHLQNNILGIADYAIYDEGALCRQLGLLS